MLKDITLGQFFPGNTIVHRLDPDEADGGDLVHRGAL